MADEQKSSSPLRIGLEALVIGGATWGLYQLPPQTIETFYSNGVFKAVAGIEGIIGDALPFSIFEGMLVAAGAAVVYLIGKAGAAVTKKIYNAVIHQRETNETNSQEANAEAVEPVANFAHRLCSVGRKASVYVLALTLLGGLNCSRQSVIDAAGISYAEQKPDLQDLVRRINEKKKKIKKLKFDKEELLPHINNSINSAYQTIHATTIPGPYKIKEPHFSLRAFNIGGITMGSFESLVDCSEKEYFTIWTLGHEKAHTKGYIREQDAEALNYLACISSGNDALEYSALLHLFFLSCAYLQDKSPDEIQKALAMMNGDTLSELRHFVSTIRDESQPQVKIARYLSDAQQKIRGDESMINAYVAQTVKALWAVDKAYKEGKLRRK